MRYIFGVFFLGVALWFGYWFIGSSAQENAVKTWLNDRQSQGWVAEYDTLNVKGFPNRFDTSIEKIELADPLYGWSVSIPRFDIKQLSYKPNHIIAVFPQTATIATPYGVTQATATSAKASVVFEPNTSLALSRVTLTLDDLGLVGSQGAVTSMGNAVLATRQAEGLEFGHDIAFNANDFKLADGLRRLLDPTAKLPQSFEKLKVEGTLGFDRPWDLDAIEGTKPRFTQIDLAELDANWGAMALQATGKVDVDTTGIPTGTVSLRAKDWKKMLKILGDTGAIAPKFLKPVEQGLNLMANLSGKKETLDLKLEFRNGFTYLGPIPIGPAPRLIVR